MATSTTGGVCVVGRVCVGRGGGTTGEVYAKGAYFSDGPYILEAWRRHALILPSWPSPSCPTTGTASTTTTTTTGGVLRVLLPRQRPASSYSFRLLLPPFHFRSRRRRTPSSSRTVHGGRDLGGGGV